MHPEDLYRLCIAVAGELATFTRPSKRPMTIPVYVHERLRGEFRARHLVLRAAFSTETEQVAISIPIEPKKYG